MPNTCSCSILLPTADANVAEILAMFRANIEHNPDPVGRLIRFDKIVDGRLKFRHVRVLGL